MRNFIEINEVNGNDWFLQDRNPLAAISNELEDTIQLALSFNEDGSMKSADVVGVNLGAFEQAARDAIEQTLLANQTTDDNLDEAIQKAAETVFGGITDKAADDAFGGISARIGAYTNFGDAYSGGESVAPKAVRLAIEPAGAVGFFLQGITDMHENARGELTRDEVNQFFMSDDAGNLTVNLLPGTYVLKQTDAPDGYLVNEQLYQIQVGSGGYVVDGNESGSVARVKLAKKAREYLLSLSSSDGTRVAGETLHMVGMTAEEPPIRFVSSGFTDKAGRLSISLPLGSFSLYDETPPYTPLAKLSVSTVSTDIINEDVVLTAPHA